MIHDLYLRAHTVVLSDDTIEQGKPLVKTARPPKLWPYHTLVWDTETSVDLQQTLNFGSKPRNPVFR